ncbi:Hypothetical Protein FCC1311_082542 [Hondaea fermentalgiana]|uniref:F5/8 type C domain-containing protein n=1 Tax=Hondaea fermentalgiana TaxID=2315210 RepID=A0A2R5GNZ9_9STRA|nr:Hypothetical Protein FCC1311_082542 [Hondaea fermentalgiana]|eukprot:GBG32029.1 Hypothetical Protein FCC1311_082542 [Hondaea fermentalgiana]
MLDDVEGNVALVSAVQATRTRVLCEVTPRIPWPRTEHVDFEELVRRRRKRGDAFREPDALPGRPADVRALITHTATIRSKIHETLLHIAAATTRYENVLDSLGDAEIDLVALFEEYIALVMLVAERQDAEIQDHEPDPLLQNFATSWSGILSVEQIPVNSLRTEITCAFLAAATVQAFFARFGADRILNKMNAEFVGQDELGEALLEAAKSLRKAAGIANCAATWALRHNIVIVGGIGASVQDACREMADGFLISAQTLCAASFACCKGKLRDFKMAALMCETSTQALLRLRQARKRQHARRRFPRDAAAVMLGFFYLFQAEAAVLENRRGPWAIYTWLCALCFRYATEKHSAWLHLQPLVKSTAQVQGMKRNLPADADSWKHALHAQCLGATPADASTDVLMHNVPIAQTVGLLVEAMPFQIDLKAAQDAVTTQMQHLLGTMAQSNIAQGESQTRNRPSSPLRHDLSVTPWKYGIERLGPSSYMRYDAFTGVTERIYPGESRWRPRQTPETEAMTRARTHAPCGVCEREFPVESLAPSATKRGVTKLRSLWGALQKDAKVRALALVHTTVKVCVFCEQFFTVPFELLHAPQKVEKTVLRPTETQQDRDIETMILDSIQTMTEESFKQLSETERKGILSGGAALSKLAEAEGAVNLALNRFATQSSTRTSNDQASALNAVDDNLFGNPACTEKESQPWWQVDLRNLAHIYAVRTWTMEQRVRARIVHVMIARTPFAKEMTLAQAIEHSQAHHKFSYMSRVLEWCPQADDAGAGEIRGRYVRIQLEAVDERLEVVQCQVLGRPVLNRLAQTRRSSKIRKSSRSVKRKASAKAKTLATSPRQRAALQMRTFRFRVHKHNRLSDPQFIRVCPLIGKAQDPSETARDTKERGASVEALLQACKTGYENEAVFETFVTELESVVQAKLYSHLSSLDSLQDVRGMALRSRHRASIGTADSAKLANWQFEQLRACFIQTLVPGARGDLRAPAARIDSDRVADMFKIGRPGHAFVEKCSLLASASAAGKLSSATALLSRIDFVHAHGLDWCGFLLFTLCMDQLLEAQRSAVRTAEAETENSEEVPMRDENVVASSRRSRPATEAARTLDGISPPEVSSTPISAHSPGIGADLESKKTRHRLPTRLVPLALRESDCAMCGHDFIVDNLSATITITQAREKLTIWRAATRLDRYGLTEEHVTYLARRLAQPRAMQLCRSFCRSVGIPLLKAQTRVSKWTRLDRVSKIASVAVLRLQWWWRRVRLRWARLPRPPRPKSCEKRMELILLEMEHVLSVQQRDERKRVQRAWRTL